MLDVSIIDKIKVLIRNDVTTNGSDVRFELQRINHLAKNNEEKKTLILTAPTGHQLLFYPTGTTKLKNLNQVPIDICNIDINEDDTIEFKPLTFMLQSCDTNPAEKERLIQKEIDKMKNIVYSMLTQPECLFVTFGDN